MGPKEAVQRLANRQGRRVRRAQWLQAGMTDEGFARHATSLGWERELRGQWAEPGAPKDYEGRCHSWMLAVGRPVLLTGASALLRYGMVRRRPKDVELLLPAHRWLRPRDGVCLHYSTDFAALGSRTIDDLAMTSVPRAAADYSAHATVNEVVVAIATGMRLRICTLDRCRAERDARIRFPGKVVFTQAIAALAGEVTHSAGEQRGRHLLIAAGHRPHHEPFAVTRGGRTIAEIDIPFLDVRYGVEVDGPHHLDPAVAANDRARDRELSRCGWTIDRFLWHEIEDHPDAFVREVTTRLRQLREKARMGG